MSAREEIEEILEEYSDPVLWMGGVVSIDLLRRLLTEMDEIRAATLREAAEVIRTSKHLRSWTDDHMGDIEEAAWVLQEKAEEEK